MFDVFSDKNICQEGHHENDHYPKAVTTVLQNPWCSDPSQTGSPGSPTQGTQQTPEMG
jgi:hypothetical protein